MPAVTYTLDRFLLKRDGQILGAVPGPLAEDVKTFGFTCAGAEIVVADMLKVDPDTVWASPVGKHIRGRTDRRDTSTTSLTWGIVVSDFAPNGWGWYPASEQWTVGKVATFLGVSPASVRKYRVRDGSFPPPDGVLERTPWWRPETIRAWQASRPGRTGRPRKIEQP